MKTKETGNHKNKWMYSNYQFYEKGALIECLEEQQSRGYSLSGAIGGFRSILKFRYEKSKGSKSYVLYYKQIDKKIDIEIENMKKSKCEVVCENNRSIIFRSSAKEIDKTKVEVIEEIQNKRLSVSVKKTATYIAILLLFSIICLGLKVALIQNGNRSFNLLSLSLYIGLLVNFLFYFTGDLHDFFVGKGTQKEGRLYFSSRTKFKNTMFHIGDILKFVILISGICISGVILLYTKDWVLDVSIVKMWIIFLIIGFGNRIRLQRSYLTLLLVEVFLLTVSFY